MNVYKWIIIALYIVSTIVTISSIGKPRAPLTPGVVAVITVINLGVIALVVAA